MIANGPFVAEPAAFTTEALHTLLEWAHKTHISDIILRDDRPPIVKLHGVAEPVARRRLIATELINIVKDIYLASADSPLSGGQDMDFAYELTLTRDERCRFRVNVTAHAPVNGIGRSVSLTPPAIPDVPPTIDELDTEPAIVNAITDARAGLVLVTGPTGSGKSTLLAAAMRRLIETPPGKIILSYESPIEFNLGSLSQHTDSVVSQVQILINLPDFAAAVRNCLRRAPDIILIAEARDKETISGMIRAAQTGHLVMSTSHTNGVAASIARLTDEFPAEERHAMTIKLIDSIRIIIHQRLIRTVDGGRVALREWLVFTPAMRDRLITQVQAGAVQSADKTWEYINHLLTREGQPLMLDAQQKLSDNIISAEEYRVLASEYGELSRG